ncbi:MAG: twin-arginine translocation signal domain-containing protein [Tannerellaceae bacterium]|jgi:alpha-mannosidase|nr:twin-arginine translocation signal domain-containing protein [Tannerellaceae bacterium]
MKTKRIISRRAFLRDTALGTAAVALTPFNSVIGNVTQAAWPAGAGRYRFRMIGHGHIDPVWLWRWAEGVSVVHSTFRSALDRMAETPGMVFACSSARFYQWVADNDPGMLEEVRRRIREGRWNVVGGWWIEPDMNIPCGEAMVRQGLYGQLAMQRLLGVRATVAFNPDSFGHTGTLPQIIRKQGMENYVFMRPQRHEKTIPADLFWWEGPDGSRVLTYRIQESYTDNRSVRRRIESVLKIAGAEPAKTFMAFYGVGDHGGGPTKENLRSIAEIKKEEGAPALVYSSVNAYFEEIRVDKSLDIPTVKDDLQHHAVGCYTSESAIKKGNRLAEAALATAEKITALGALYWGNAYPKGPFEAAWKKALFLQFHDSLAGSSLVSHSKDAAEGYGYVLDTAHEATWMAIQKLEWQIAAEDPESDYLLAFNPHAWEVKANIRYDFGWDSLPASTAVVDAGGHSLPYQWVPAESQTGGRKGLVVTARLPAMGYCQIRIMQGAPHLIGKRAGAEGDTLENEYYKIRFSSHGTLSILDRETGKEVFANGAKGCRAVIIDDPSDAWGHDVKAYDREIGSFGEANIKTLCNGPLKATIRVTSRYGQSKLTADWSLYAGQRCIEADITLDWHERQKMLKFSFPVDVQSPVATYETPYGFIEREANGNEDPGQRWIDVTGRQGTEAYGLAVLNDAKYGYSVKDNDMRVTIVRSPVFAHHDPRKLDDDQEYAWMDQGLQTFRMALVPHKGGWKEAGIPRIAEAFVSPPVALYQGIHPGSMPRQASFLSVDKPNIIVSSVKQSETGNDLIIRCVETNGQQTDASLQLPAGNCKWNGSFGRCEIKTLRYNPKKGTIKEVNLLEE